MLDAVGWAQPADPPETVDVPITPGMAEQLFNRRYELGHGNIDRLASCDEPDESLWAQIHADRDAAITLHRFAAVA